MLILDTLKTSSNHCASLTPDFIFKSFLSLPGGLDGSVSALMQHQSRIVVGGSFTVTYSSNGSILDCGGIAQWDPATSQWGSVGTSGSGLAPGSIVFALAVAAATRLVVAGRFSFAGGRLANNVAVYEGELTDSSQGSSSTWQTLGGGVGEGYVTSLAVSGLSNSLIYVGGTFQSVYPEDSSSKLKYRCETFVIFPLFEEISIDCYAICPGPATLLCGMGLNGLASMTLIVRFPARPTWLMAHAP